MISLKNVSLDIKGVKVLDKISADARKGDYIVINGPDDSGKTSLLKVIAGLAPTFEGKMSLFGKNSEDFTEAEEQRICFVPDDLIQEDKMTVREYLDWSRECSDYYSDVIEASLIKRLEIDYNAQIRALSKNKNKCVQLIAAVASGADVLLLDEPDNFLDEDTLNKWLRIFNAINIGGKTIIMTACTGSVLAEANRSEKVWKMSGGRLECRG